MQKDVIDELRKSANKFAVLDAVFEEVSENALSKNQGKQLMLSLETKLKHI